MRLIGFVSPCISEDYQSSYKKMNAVVFNGKDSQQVSTLELLSPTRTMAVGDSSISLADLRWLLVLTVVRDTFTSLALACKDSR